MAAAATTTPSAGTAGRSTASTSRFAAACSARGQYVKAAELARPAVPVRPLPLMPGADVDAYVPDEQEQPEAGPAPAQLTIVYDGRTLVLDDVPADKAANLLHLAATAARGGAVEPQPSTATCGWQIAAAADLPVTRKASLQRFMEKRKGRAAARGAPYRRSDGSDACPGDHLKLAL